MSQHASASLMAFMAAAEAGSFAGAASALGISAAAIGQNIKRLEDSYGVSLFTRTTRKMSLTPEGMLLYERAREPLRELEELDHILEESRGEAKGTLRITAPRFIAEHYVLPIVRAFREQHPQLRVDIDASDAVRDLVKDPIDVAFRIGMPSDSTMIARKLTDLRIHTVASPEWVERHGLLTHPDEIMRHQCLRFRFVTSGVTWLWRYNIDGESKDYDPPGDMMFNEPEIMIAACLAGDGLLQMDTLFVQRYVDAGRLVTLLDDYATGYFQAYIAYPSRRNLPYRTRAFVDFALRTFPDIMKGDHGVLPR